MKQGKTILAVTVAVAAALVLLFLLFRALHNPPPETWDWTPGYNTTGTMKNEPYSLGKLYQLFGKRNGTGKLIAVAEPFDEFLAKQKPNKEAVYLCMGYQPYYTDLDIEAMLNFVRSGNTVFLAVNNLPNELILKLNVPIKGQLWDGFITKTSFKAKATLPVDDPAREYIFTYQYMDTIQPFPWRYFAPGEFDAWTVRSSIKGYLNDTLPCYYEVGLGKGAILIHANPIFFTNYYLIKPDGYRYASRVFSFISPDTDIWFDHWALDPFNQKIPKARPESWLGFFLKSPGLKWAWMILLLMALLFLSLRSRRKQRPIPVLEPNLNTVMEYTHAIANIYLKNKDHKAFARQMHQLFLRQLSVRYKINLHQNREDLMRMVILRTGAPETLINNIFDTADALELQHEVTARQLMQWHMLIHRFNKQTKPDTHGS